MINRKLAILNNNVAASIAHTKRNKGKMMEGVGLSFGDTVYIGGDEFIVFDYGADRSYPGGVSLILATPSFSLLVHDISIEEISARKPIEVL